MKKFLSAVTALSICAVPAWADTDDETIAIDDPVPCVIADLPSDLVDFTAEAADAGILTVSNGGEVSDDDVTTYGWGPLSVAFNEAYRVVEDKEPYYPVTGSGTFPWDYVTVSIDDTVYDLIINSGETGVEFWLIDSNFTIPEGFYVILAEGYEDFTVSLDFETGIATVWYAAAPEPSMFGLMFGLGALGLVATRRRRRAA